jgi:hypothetical protein
VRRRALLLGGAAVLTGCGGDGDAEERRRRAGGDLDIVAFAATLEAVENAFWEEVVDRGALAAVGAGASALAADVLRNERAHLARVERRLRDLGAPAAPQPRTDFSAVFARGPRSVLRAGATLENVAAAAYLGQASRIQDRDVLADAVAIHTVEARQAAALNALAGRRFRGDGRLQGTLPDGAFAEPLSMEDTLQRLDRYLADA